METAEIQDKQRDTFALEQLLRNGAKEFKVLSYSNVSMSLGNHTALSETIFRSNSEINVLILSQYSSPLRYYAARLLNLPDFHYFTFKTTV